MYPRSEMCINILGKKTCIEIIKKKNMHRRYENQIIYPYNEMCIDTLEKKTCIDH